ncbi:MAG: S8 family serine peptidase, partial [Chloroflexi bacterium]|nr:S8 family serine peptidase [Chloroflexota bacterium]
MKRHFALYLAIVWCLSGLVSGASQAQGGAIPPHEAGLAEGAAASTTWLLRLRDGMPPERARQVLSSAGLMPLREIPRIHVWVVEPQGASMQRAIVELRERGEILWAEPNGLCYAAAVHPDDTYYWANQWNLRLIGLPDAWMFSRGDSRPIAIVDTGADLNHPDLAAKFWRNTGEIPGNYMDDDANGYVDDFFGWNFAYGTPSPQDDNGHGTHVAGIAGAATDNGVGVAGVSWLSPVMPLKALWYDGTGSWSDIAEAIIYAADNGAHIINLSLGASTYSTTLHEAVQYAYERGCLLVAAAGNYCSS